MSEQDEGIGVFIAIWNLIRFAVVLAILGVMLYYAINMKG
jgi:hypothetical protein